MFIQNTSPFIEVPGGWYRLPHPSLKFLEVDTDYLTLHWSSWKWKIKCLVLNLQECMHLMLWMFPVYRLYCIPQIFIWWTCLLSLNYSGSFRWLSLIHMGFCALWFNLQFGGFLTAFLLLISVQCSHVLRVYFMYLLVTVCLVTQNVVYHLVVLLTVAF